VLIAPDLGLLLRRCNRVVVRLGADPVLLETEVLIQWRALRVVTGNAYLPCPDQLRELFPDCETADTSFQVLTRNCSPEAVLAECLTRRIPVAETQIIYGPPMLSPTSLPVDATLSAPLR
jgi:hypothetical protein